MTLQDALLYVNDPVLDVAGIDGTALEGLAKADYELPPGSADARDPHFAERIQVNYLRHRCSRYDEVASALRAYSQPASALQALRENTLDAIASRFSHLANECERQRARRAEQTAFQRATEQRVSSLARIREEVTMRRILSYDAGIAALPADAVVKYLYELNGASFVMQVGQGGFRSFDNWMNARTAPRRIQKMRAALRSAIDPGFRGPMIFDHCAERVRR